jgi:hypothetical protein
MHAINPCEVCRRRKGHWKVVLIPCHMIFFLSLQQGVRHSTSFSAAFNTSCSLSLSRGCSFRRAKYPSTVTIPTTNARGYHLIVGVRRPGRVAYIWYINVHDDRFSRHNQCLLPILATAPEVLLFPVLQTPLVPRPPTPYSRRIPQHQNPPVVVLSCTQ